MGTVRRGGQAGGQAGRQAWEQYDEVGRQAGRWGGGQAGHHFVSLLTFGEAAPCSRVLAVFCDTRNTLGQ